MVNNAIFGRAGLTNKMADVFDGVQVSLDETEKKVL